MKPITYEGEDLTNIITKFVMPVHVQKDVYNQDEIGQKMYAKYVAERINTNEVSFTGLGHNEKKGATEDVEKYQRQ